MNDQVRDSQRLTGVRSETFEPSDLFHHSSFIIHHSLSLALLLTVLLPTARAQPTGAPPRDPGVGVGRRLDRLGATNRCSAARSTDVADVIAAED